MSNLVTDTNALAAVRAFLGPQESNASESEEEQVPIARPARLGLGAKWVGQNVPGGGAHGSAAVGARRLGASLRVEQAYSQSKSDDDSSDSNEDDSRVRVAEVKARRRLQLKRTANKDKHFNVDNVMKLQKKNVLDLSKKDLEGQNSGTPVNRGTGASGLDMKAPMKSSTPLKYSLKGTIEGDDIKQVSGEIGDALERQSSASSPLRSSNKDTVVNPESGEPNCKRKGTVNWKTRPFNANFTSSGVLKKRKIRSRQKNLKRDKRPKHLLPAHLTEETLRGGRVVRPLPPTELPSQSP